ncbi:MAG: site-2 protease family protein [Chitinispirillales bacterium]|jgi:Zn-dependent protease|nr:site-2 protease family protein [Chitinispirillales bacterium]
MFGRKIRLFSIFGFQVSIDMSWIIIAVLITWSLAQGVFPLFYKDLTPAAYWIMGAVGAVGLFASIVFHELCHSLAARRFGLPMRGITLFIFGGVAEMEDEPPSARAEFFIAVAGPVSSVFLGFFFWGVLLLGSSFAWPVPVLIIFSYLRIINLVLAVFNMLPAYPLDGGRVFRSILWGIKGNIVWATKVASAVGTGFGLALVAAGIFSVFTGNIVTGIWWALIGLFVRGASRMSYENVLVRGALQNEPVKRFVDSDPVTVPAYTTVDHMIENYVYKYDFNIYPVVGNCNLKCVNVDDVKRVPRPEWPSHKVDEYAKPCSSDNSVLDSENAMKALAVMNRTGNSRIMVVTQGGELVGTVSQNDLVRFLMVNKVTRK